MRRILVRIARGVVTMAIVIAGGGFALLWAFQEALIFPAGREVWRTPFEAPFNWSYESVTLRAGSETTAGWYVPVGNAKGVILFSHGNGGNIADRMEHYAILRDFGYDIFAYDYGGYGDSTGKPSEKRCCADIRAAWKYLTETRGIAPDRIILYGESLGTGATCDFAGEVKPRAAILQSPFLSVSKRAKEIFPIVPVNLLLKHRFDSDKKIGKIAAPILIIHSREDTIIPFRHGQQLFELANEPKSFLELHGDHNDCIFTSEQTYRNGMARFLGTL